MEVDILPGVKLVGGVLVCAVYQKLSVSLRHAKIFFALLLTPGEDTVAVAFAEDDDDRVG